MKSDVPSPRFDLDALGFSIPGRTILEPLTLSLEPGRIHGLIGGNGSGKSTLVRLLARHLSPTAGMASFAGVALPDWRDRAFARQVAYMPQFTSPADGMTVRELVALGRFPWHGTLGRFGAQDAAHVERALDITGLSPLADRLVDTLSGGERQRAWLGVMLAQDTRCIILDEPTSALDVAREVEMLELMKRQCRERGVTVIVVLHDINLAARVCDDVVALRAGRLVAHGTVSEVLRPQLLEEIFGLPMGVMTHPTRNELLSYVL